MIVTPGLTITPGIVAEPGPWDSTYLVVAGGGGGSGFLNVGTPGGGGGGVLTNTIELKSGTTYTITVGGGGPPNYSGPNTFNISGSSSSISAAGLTTILATGGGGGIQAKPTGPGGSLVWGFGVDGGSGGGEIGYAYGDPNLPAPGNGIPGQGLRGGYGASQNPAKSYGGPGGGGYLSTGANSFSDPNYPFSVGWTGGPGGQGFISDITGVEDFYGSGGGGSATNVGIAPWPDCAGGSGGINGGSGYGTQYGSGYSAVAATPGAESTGAGGGGGYTAQGGNGGSGVVIIKTLLDAVGFSGANKYKVGDHFIYKFTISGWVQF